MNIQPFLLVIILPFIVNSAWADDDCNEPTMPLIEDCHVEQSYKPVEKLYKKLQSIQEKKYGKGDHSFKDTQEAWKSYRDFTCDYESMYPTDLTICLIKFNDARVKTLRKYLAEENNGKH